MLDADGPEAYEVGSQPVENNVHNFKKWLIEVK